MTQAVLRQKKEIKSVWGQWDGAVGQDACSQGWLPEEENQPARVVLYPPHMCHGRGTWCTHAHTHTFKQTEIGVFTIPAGAGAAAYLQIGEQSPKAQDYKAWDMKPGCWATAANEMRKPQWISYPELEGEGQRLWEVRQEFKDSRVI